jgi:hypothetical protein
MPRLSRKYRLAKVEQKGKSRQRLRRAERREQAKVKCKKERTTKVEHKRRKQAKF